MARLIDVDALMQFPIRLNHYDRVNGNEHYVFGVEAVLEYAENLPTIDAEPVRHGKWEVLSDDVIRCSHCLNEWAIRDKGEFVIIDAKEDLQWCPSCGAKMDLEGE